jgi:predicted MFS family arabinose efflux permease
MTESPREKYFAALANPQFRLLFLARTTSLFGDAFAPIALAFAVLEVGGSASDLGLVLAATTLPRAAFMLFGGVVGDRLRRDRLLVATDAVQALAQAVVGVLLVTGHASVWEIAAIQAVRGTASAFFYPAATGLLPQLVPRSMLQQANALLGMSMSTTAILGVAAGGAIVAVVGPGTALLVDAATFAASGLFVLGLRLPPAARTVVTPGLWHELVEGWREFTRRAWLWKTVVYFAVFNAAVLAPYLVLGPFVAESSLEGAAAWAAIVTAAAGGGLLGSWVALRVRPQRPLRAGFVAVLGMAPAFALLAVAAPTVVVTAAAAFWGFGLQFFSVLWETALQEHVPGEALSRVAAYDWLVTLTCAPLGLVLVGPIAALFSVSATLWGSATVLVAATLAMLAMPDVRGLERAVM